MARHSGSLENGQSLKSIRQWLEEEAGIAVSISSFTSYISRIRRREPEKPRAQRTIEPRAELASTSSPTRTRIANPLPNDPLAQAMQALSKPKLDIRQIHGDGDPRGKNLI